MPQDANWVQQDEERLFFFPGNDSAKKKSRILYLQKHPPQMHTHNFIFSVKGFYLPRKGEGWGMRGCLQGVADSPLQFSAYPKLSLLRNRSDSLFQTNTYISLQLGQIT